MIRSRSSLVPLEYSRRQAWHSTRRAKRGTSNVKNIICNAGKSDGDFVTRVLGGLFGRDDAEPLGLKRIEDDPEIYPATADEWADIVPGDEGEIAVVRPLLAGTSLQAAPLRLAYNADKDGWNADSFHAKVNTYGAALVVAQTTGGAILGGYNPLDGDLTKRPIKLPKVGGPAMAVIDKADQGPQFGPDGLRIPLLKHDPKVVFSKLGSYYAKLPAGGKKLFAEGEEVKKGKGTQLEWLRVYVSEGGYEVHKLDGIVWKTSKSS